MPTDWTALLLAAGTGGLAATLINAFAKYCVFHPVISVRLDERRGSYTDVIDVTDVYYSGGGYIGPASVTHKARYLRLHVENTGLSSIKGCLGFITQMTKHLPGVEQVSRQEVIDLDWSHHTSERNIPRGAFFHMDVVSIHEEIHEEPEQPVLKWKLRLSRLPTTLKQFLADKATYEFDVRVAADNAKPRTIRVSPTIPIATNSGSSP